MTKPRPSQWARTAAYGALAGAAGGLAEILWIAFYGTLSGSNASEVAQAISAVMSAALPSAAWTEAPVVAGIAIHMLAAIGLGVALVIVWRTLALRGPGAIGVYSFMLAALAAVWTFNFFVVLPLIGPNFADLSRIFIEVVPYPASLLSKLLFGLAAAAMLRYGKADGPAVVRAGS
jgi:hypothetical protein